jgi:hypothetical protein
MSRSNRRIRARSRPVEEKEGEEDDEVEAMLQSRGQSVRQRLDFQGMRPRQEHPLLDSVTTIPLHNMYSRQHLQDLMDEDVAVNREVARGRGPIVVEDDDDEEEHDDDPASQLPPYPIGRRLTDPVQRRRYIHQVTHARPAPPYGYRPEIDGYRPPPPENSYPLPSDMIMSSQLGLRSEFERFRDMLREVISPFIPKNNAPPVIPEEKKSKGGVELDPTNTKMIDILSKCLDTCDLCYRWDRPGLVFLHDKYRPLEPGNNPICTHKLCLECYFKLEPQRVSEESNPNLKMHVCPFCRQRMYLLPMPEESTMERRIAWQKIHTPPPSSSSSSSSIHSSSSTGVAKEGCICGYCSRSDWILGLDINTDAVSIGGLRCSMAPGKDNPNDQPSIHMLERVPIHKQVTRFLALFRSFTRHLHEMPESRTEVKAVYYYLIQLRASIKETLDEMLLSEPNKHLDMVQFILSPVDTDGEESNLDIKEWIEEGTIENTYTRFSRMIEQDQEADEKAQAEEHALPLQPIEHSEVIEEKKAEEDDVLVLVEESPDRIQYDGKWYSILILDGSCFQGDKMYEYPFPLNHPTLPPCILPDRHSSLALYTFSHNYPSGVSFQRWVDMHERMKKYYTESIPTEEKKQEVLPNDSEALPPLIKYYIFWAKECAHTRASINEWRLPLRRVYFHCRKQFPQYRLHLFRVYLNLFYGYTYHTFFHRLIMGRNAQLFDYLVCKLSDVRYENVMKYLEACYFYTKGDMSQERHRREYFGDVNEPIQGVQTQSDRQILLAITSKPQELYTLPPI